MKSNNIDIMLFKKEITYHNSDDNVCSDTVLMNEDDKTDIEKKLDSSVDEIFTIDKSLYIDNINEKGWISEKEIKGYCVINESFLDKYNNYTIIGNLPSNSNEIVITDYHLLLFKLYGYKYNTVNFIIKKPENIIGRKLNILSSNKPNLTSEFTITGILDTGFDFDKYSILYEPKDNGLDLYNEKNEFDHEKNYSIIDCCLVHENFKSVFVDLQLINEISTLNFNINSNSFACATKGVTHDISSLSNYFLLKDENTDLNVERNEVFLPLSIFSEASSYYLLDSGSTSFVSENYNSSIKESWAIDEEHNINTYLSYLKDNDYEDLTYGNITKKAILQYGINNYLYENELIIDGKFNKITALLQYQVHTYNVNVVGLYYDLDNYDSAESLYCSLDFEKSLRDNYNNITGNFNYISHFIYRLDDNVLKAISLINNEIKNEHTRYYPKYNSKNEYITSETEYYYSSNEVIESYNYWDSIQCIVVRLLLIFSLIFIVIYIQFMIYYSCNIFEKYKNDIGIFRSLGYSDFKTLLPFTLGFLFIGLVTFIVSTVLSISAINILNNLQYIKLGILIPTMSFSFIHILISLCTSFLPTFLIFLCVFKINNKKNICELLIKEE